MMNNKRTITAIWAQNRDGVIGKDGKLPWHIPEELTHFKKATMGKALVMGRRTYESLPNDLDGRYIIVLTKNKDYQLQTKSDNVLLAHSLNQVNDIHDELLLKGKVDEELMICGGSAIYEQYAPVIKNYVVSYVDKHIPIAETDIDSLDYISVRIQNSVSGVLAENPNVKRQKYDGFDIIDTRIIGKV